MLEKIEENNRRKRLDKVDKQYEIYHENILGGHILRVG